MTKCLTPDTLRLVLDGGLRDPAMKVAQSHVDGCLHCLALLEQLSEDAELRTWMRGEPIDRNEPGLNRLMQGLLDTCQSTTTPNGLPRGDLPSTAKIPGAEPSDPLVFAGYEVQRELGRGGMGIVLLANDLALHRAVAIKVLRPDRNAEIASRQRFLNEARATASVRHDHVVDLYAVIGPPVGPPYLVMEYVAGPTLRQRIEESGPLPPRDAADVCSQVATGLAAAHAAGLIHRDIKPNNILLDRVHGRAKIMDFGLARNVDAAGVTLAGELLGTPAYMSPEQIRRPDTVDERSDVYSLGATLYEALTGTEPFRGTTHGVLQQVLHEEPRRLRLLNEAVPQDLETICLHALAKEPVRRYPTASAMAEDLRRWLRGEPIQARPVGATERLWRWTRRNPRVAALTGMVAFLLLLSSVGSLIFAGRLAKEKSETLSALIQAEANAEEARDLGSAALDAHSALVFKVQEQLGNKAGTLPLRKQLLETALSGLQKIVSRPHGPDSERSVIAAYDRMSDVLNTLGRSDEAWKSAVKARDLAEKRVVRRPDDLLAQRDLGSAHDKLGTFRFVEHNFAEALDHFEKSNAIRAALVGRNAKPEWLRDLAISFNKLADVYFFSNQESRAEECYTRALRLTEDLAAAEPGNTTFKRDLRFSSGRLATLYEGRQDFVSAFTFQMKSLDRAKELAALDPTNTQWQRDFGYTAARAGTLDLKLDRVDAALEHFSTYLAVSEKLVSADPDNAQWARDLGLAHQRLAEAHFRQGNREATQAAARRALSLFERYSKKDSTSVPLRVDLILVSLQLADFEARQGHYQQAAEMCNRSVEVLGELAQEGKLQGPILTALRIRAESLQGAASQAAEVVHFENSALAPNANPTLTALWLLARARHGHHAEAAAGADRLLEHAEGDATFYAAAARIFALCAAAAPSSSANVTTPSSGNLREQYIGKSVDALTEAMRLSPSYEWHLEPDFDSIRQSARYRQLFKRAD
jgi:eukaryotic-like serine/threonine-protein kinase